MSEKMCLQWNDFKDNVNIVFGTLRDDKDFADVTLVCEDGKQLDAHKAILATSSPFFQNILARNKHSHPIIYMRGLKSEDLSALIDFIYLGQADVAEENIENFLAISEELQLKGLTGQAQDFERAEKENGSMPMPKKNKPAIKKELKTLVSMDEYKDFEEGMNNSINEVEMIADRHIRNTPIVKRSRGVEGFQELDEKCNAIMEKTDKRQANGFPLYLCKVCGKEEIKSAIVKHIENKHVEGISIPCNICEKVFR